MTFLIPYETWEKLMVRIAGPGSHASDSWCKLLGSTSDASLPFFLRKGYNINYEGGGGTTALSGASVLGSEEMVNFLVSKGADVNRKDGLSRETALMAAAEMGRLGTAKALLKNGADPLLNGQRRTHSRRASEGIRPG